MWIFRYLNIRNLEIWNSNEVHVYPLPPKKGLQFVLCQLFEQPKWCAILHQIIKTFIHYTLINTAFGYFLKRPMKISTILKGLIHINSFKLICKVGLIQTQLLTTSSFLLFSCFSQLPKIMVTINGFQSDISRCYLMDDGSTKWPCKKI